MKLRLIIPAALAAIAVAAYAQDGVVLTRAYKKGDVVRYKSVVNASVMGGEAVVTATTKGTVKEVKDNGEITVSIVDEGGTLSFGGAEQDLPAGAEVVETREKSGKLKKVAFPNGGQEFVAPEIRELMTLVADPILGDKPVKPGDKWESEIDNPAVKGKKVAFKTTYVGPEKVGEVNTWKVLQTAEALTDDKGAKLTAEYTYWLENGNGATVKAESKVSGIPTQFGDMSWTSKIERIAADVKKAL
jgi:hypothetical protein